MASTVLPGSGGANHHNHHHHQPSVCRDFLRNVCSRGAKCKFRHPPPQEQLGEKDAKLGAPVVPAPAQQEQHQRRQQPPPPPQTQPHSSPSPQAPPPPPQNDLQDSILFCHDFQNLTCHRGHCRFLHCSRQEEEEFRASGYLPPHLRDQAIRKGVAPDLPTQFGQRPICKDFLKAECKRGTCKFRHISAKQYDLELSRSIETQRQQQRAATVVEAVSEASYRPERSTTTAGFLFGEASYRGVSTQASSAATSTTDAGGYDQQQHERQPQPLMKRRKLLPDPKQDDETALLQQENLLLKERVEELKKQVHNLATTNEFLLDQNAQLRLGVKANTTTVVSALHTAGIPHIAVQPPLAQTAAPPPPAATAAAAQVQPPPPPQAVAAAGPPPHSIPSIVSIAVPVQAPSITIAAPGPPPPPEITFSAVSHGSLPAATITMAVADTPPPVAPAGALQPQPPPPPQATRSAILVQQPPPGAAMTIATAPPLAVPAVPPPPQGPPPTAVVQEPRLITYPVTSIRQM